MQNFNGVFIIKTPDKQYMYEISEKPLNRLFFAINKDTEKFEVYRIAETDKEDKSNNVIDVKDLKRFDANAIGFSEATDYFESLLFKSKI
jgi:hypothetical protein